MRALTALFLFFVNFSTSMAGNPYAFPNIYLEKPREHSLEITGKFSYNEIGRYIPGEQGEGAIVLHNGYASSRIINVSAIDFDRDAYRVSKVQIIFTKYPIHKNDWRTNYYDLLAWRLRELFKADSNLNDDRIVWEMVLQTDCVTAAQARSFYHGIVLHLEPLAVVAEETPPANPPSNYKPIENGGFLLPQDRNPAIFRSPFNFQPEPGRPLRTQMEPSKLKCPSSW
jgi:hypothetical protein